MIIDNFIGKRVLEVGDTVRYLRFSSGADPLVQGVSKVKELLIASPPILLDNGERLFHNEVVILKAANETPHYITPQHDEIPQKKFHFTDIFRF